MPALSQSLKFRPSHQVVNTTTTAVVYPNTGTDTLVYLSDKVKGDGYYGNSDGVHTVMYVATTNFVGTMTMQATLATDPVESDWFTVSNTAKTYTLLNVRTTSTADCYNFTGNFVWVRGRVSIDSGSVQYIQYNH